MMNPNFQTAFMNLDRFQLPPGVLEAPEPENADAGSRKMEKLIVNACRGSGMQMAACDRSGVLWCRKNGAWSEAGAIIKA